MEESKTQECSVIPSNRLQFFPIMMFAVIMGLSGLTIVFQKADEVLGLNIGIDFILT